MMFIDPKFLTNRRVPSPSSLYIELKSSTSSVKLHSTSPFKFSPSPSSLHLTMVANPLYCDDITPECPVEASIYGYYPDLFANWFFVAFFGLFTLLNFFVGWRYRTWSYMVGMALCCMTSAIGYAGRVIMHTNPFNSGAFKLQIILLILAPAYISAAIYITLKHICLCFGEKWSRIPPRFYTWIFISADMLSLALQGAGGGLAAGAGDNGGLRKKGDHLAMAGIVWQVFTLSMFAILVIDYVVRRKSSLKEYPYSEEARATIKSSKFRLFAIGLTAAFLTVFVRCVYRIAEMAGGWRNPIMQNEVLYIACEGALVAKMVRYPTLQALTYDHRTISAAVLLMTVFHPGYCFPRIAGTSTRGIYSPMHASTNTELLMRPTVYKHNST